MLDVFQTVADEGQACPLRTFEHGGRLIYVYAYRSVPRGWAIDVAVVGPNGGHQPQALHIAWDTAVSCPSLDEALATAEEMARAFVDGVAIQQAATARLQRR